MGIYSTRVNTIIAALGTGFTWLFGTWDIALVVLILFMGVDYVSGVLRGLINKKLSSSVGLIGIARKGVIFLILIVGVALDRLLGTGTWTFRTLICYFYIANEGLSILENVASMGVPFPEKLKDILVQLKEGQKKESINKKEGNE